MKVDKYLTDEERKAKEKAEKEEEERLKKEQKDNWRERGLEDMMNGVLEMRKEDELKKVRLAYYTFNPDFFFLTSIFNLHFFFFRIVSYFCLGSMFLLRHLHSSRSYASSPVNSLSDKSSPSCHVT